MSVFVMLVDRKNSKQYLKESHEKPKEFVRKTLMNKKLIQQANCNKPCPEKVYM